MNAYEVAAIVGALAWTPTIVQLVLRYALRAKIRLVAANRPEIGFTPLGPIINLRLAFAVSRKDIVVESLSLRLRHESGEERRFEWQGIVRHLGQMGTPGEQIIPFQQEQSVLAIQLQAKSVDERFIRFQETAFQGQKEECEAAAAKKLAFLQQTPPLNHDAFLASQEMRDLYTFVRQSFCWKEGEYTITFEMDSRDPFNLEGNVYRFRLTRLDIEVLEKNKELIELSYETTVKLGVEGYEPKEVSWSWRNPVLARAKQEN